jgi:hypothetical protein
MLNELLLASVIGWMLTGALAGCYTIYKVVTIIVKKYIKSSTKGTPNDKN